ncbi:hypothetical protein ACKTEK_06425 [Tepidamorphus sp. 3E244]|uniref:hypothetical protein n=1 Tax=Tepidamorphus sp. 3E244 TaxID=3385498 RepID=UPI0038FC7AE9
MSYGLIGGLAGLAIGVTDYVIFGSLIRKLNETMGNAAAVRALEIARLAQLIAFPVVGYVIGTMLLAS